MQNFNERIAFIRPKGTYPTVFNDDTFSYYEQISALVAIIEELNTEINAAAAAIAAAVAEIDGKQDKLTFDDYPTIGSFNPVYSNGIASQISLLTQLINSINAQLTAAINGKQDQLTFDTEPTQNSANPVTSGGLFTYIKTRYDTLTGLIAAKQDLLTFDTEPTNGSTNPVTSGGLYETLRGIVTTLQTAINGKQDTLTFDANPTQNSTNPVTSEGVFKALAGKQALAISGTFTIASSDWQPVTGTLIRNYEKTITGLKTNAVLLLQNSEPDIDVNYAVAANKILFNTTDVSVDRINITIKFIAFNDTDERS